jgi:hypothetical protein
MNDKEIIGDIDIDLEMDLEREEPDDRCEKEMVPKEMVGNKRKIDDLDLPETTTCNIVKEDEPYPKHKYTLTIPVMQSSEAPRKKLRVMHDRYNPFLIDRVLQGIIHNLAMSMLQNATLVSKRWHLFASQRLNDMLFFNSEVFTDNDINVVVYGLEKIKDRINNRLNRLSQIRRHRLTSRFYLWRDNGLNKQAMASPPGWVYKLNSQGFPLSEFRTYTMDEVFHWIMESYRIDDKGKEYWFKRIVESNVGAFVFGPKQQ